MTGTSSDTVGVIGLGAMGTGMARRLLGAGFAVQGFDVRPDAASALAAEGATAAGTGQQPGTVYAQDVPPNTKRNIRQPVTLTYYSANNTLPSYVGTTPAAATQSATIAASTGAGGTVETYQALPCRRTAGRPSRPAPA